MISLIKRRQERERRRQISRHRMFATVQLNHLYSELTTTTGITHQLRRLAIPLLVGIIRRHASLLALIHFDIDKTQVTFSFRDCSEGEQTYRPYLETELSEIQSPSKALTLPPEPRRWVAAHLTQRQCDPNNYLLQPLYLQWDLLDKDGWQLIDLNVDDTVITTVWTLDHLNYRQSINYPILSTLPMLHWP